MPEAKLSSEEARSKICEYLKKQHVVTVCVANKTGESWCASCFYAFDKETMTFYFLTDPVTKHGSWMEQNAKVSGTVASQPRMIQRIQGLQYTGTARIIPGGEDSVARRLYMKTFPMAVVSKTPIWSLEIETAKFTDNRLGFGTKVLWSRTEA